MFLLNVCRLKINNMLNIKMQSLYLNKYEYKDRKLTIITKKNTFLLKYLKKYSF